MNASLLWALSFWRLQSHSTWHSTKIFFLRMRGYRARSMLSFSPTWLYWYFKGLLLLSDVEDLCLQLFVSFPLVTTIPLFRVVNQSFLVVIDCSQTADTSGHIFSKVGMQDKFLVQVRIWLRFKNVTLLQNLSCVYQLLLPDLEIVLELELVGSMHVSLKTF